MSTEQSHSQNQEVLENTKLKAWHIGVGATLLSSVLIAIMYWNQTPPYQKPKVSNISQVETVSISTQEGTRAFWASGNLMPAQQVEVRTAIAGQIIWIASDLREGAALRQHQSLLKLDPREAQAALAQAKANQHKAWVELQLEQSRADIAEQEWRALHPSSKEAETHQRQASILTRRIPQLEAAKANHEATKAAVSQAELQLERTVIRAPFDAIVHRESVSLGQQLTPQSPIASLYGSQQGLLTLDVPLSTLKSLHEHQQAEVQISTAQNIRLAQPEFRRAKILNVGSSLDPISRTGRVIVSVTDPLALKDQTLAPLYFGEFIKARLLGERFKNALKIPLTALRDGDTIFLKSSEQTLHKVQVTVLERTARNAWVVPHRELGSNDTATIDIIVSRLAAATEGMKVSDASSTEIAEIEPPAHPH